MPGLIGFLGGGSGGAGFGNVLGDYINATYGLAGSLAGTAASAYGAKQQLRASKRLFNKNLAFQEQMYDTRYQRTMADLAKAGLNPLLVGNLGAGGVTGGSSIPNLPNVLGGAEGAVARGISTALQGRTYKASVRQAEGQAAEAERRPELVNQQIETERLRQSGYLSEISLNSARQAREGFLANLAEADAMRAWLGIPEARRISEIYQNDGGRELALARQIGQYPGAAVTLPGVAGASWFSRIGTSFRKGLEAGWSTRGQ